MDYSSGLPGPGCYWCLPPSISASCAAWLPCNSAWSVGCTLFSLLRVHCGIKGLALCGVLLPSTPLWNGLALLCSATLRYSSLMFQDPHWMSVKALEHPLWFSRALSPPVLCSSFVWGCPCVGVWSCPCCSALSPSCCFALSLPLELCVPGCFPNLLMSFYLTLVTSLTVGLLGSTVALAEFVL